MDLPRHKESTIVRHEWIIGTESEHTDAKTFRMGIHHAQNEMDNLGVHTENDDAFKVRAGEGGEVILYLDFTRSGDTNE